MDNSSDGRGIRYLALGDSFTIGTGTTEDRAFPAVLAARWRARRRSVALTNPAVNGYTSAQLVALELPHLAAVRPTLVTVLVGANDIVQRVSEDRYRENLRLTYDAVAAAKVPPTATYALPQPEWSRSPAAAAYGDAAAQFGEIERFNAIAREEVERAGGTYVDLFPLMRVQAAKAMLAPDGLHPSAEAYAEWAAALDEVLLVP